MHWSHVLKDLDDHDCVPFKIEHVRHICPHPCTTLKEHIHDHQGLKYMRPVPSSYEKTKYVT